MIPTVLFGVKTGERRTEHFHIVAVVAQVMIHVPEVCMDVVPIPENMIHFFDVTVQGWQQRKKQIKIHTALWGAKPEKHVTYQSRGSFFMRRLSLGK